MHRPRVTPVVVVLGLLALFAPSDATARPRDARARLHAPTSMTAGARSVNLPHARLRIRARRRGTEMAVSIRGLEPDTEHVLHCQALTEDAVPFVTDERGRARLRRLPADDGSRGDVFEIEVCDPDGFAVLEGEIDHPGHHGMHMDEHASARSPHTHPAHSGEADEHPHDGVHEPGEECDPIADDGSEHGDAPHGNAHHGTGDTAGDLPGDGHASDEHCEPDPSNPGGDPEHDAGHGPGGPDTGAAHHGPHHG